MELTWVESVGSMRHSTVGNRDVHDALGVGKWSGYDVAEKNVVWAMENADVAAAAAVVGTDM